MPYTIQAIFCVEGGWRWHIYGKRSCVCVSHRTYPTERSAMQAAYKFVKQLRLRGATAE